LTAFARRILLAELAWWLSWFCFVRWILPAELAGVAARLIQEATRALAALARLLVLVGSFRLGPLGRLLAFVLLAGSFRLCLLGPLPGSLMKPQEHWLRWPYWSKTNPTKPKRLQDWPKIARGHHRKLPRRRQGISRHHENGSQSPVVNSTMCPLGAHPADLQDRTTRTLQAPKSSQERFNTCKAQILNEESSKEEAAENPNKNKKKEGSQMGGNQGAATTARECKRER